MNAGPPPQVARKPANAPSKADLAERDRYAMLSVTSMEMVQASAKTWRTGLAAFITLVTTGVIIRGPDTTNAMTWGWRMLVTVLAAGGLLLAVLGLWQVLAAEAGTDPRKQTLQDIRATFGTLAAYQVHLADVAARRLRQGQRTVAASVVMLLAGIAAAWWAPGVGANTRVAVYVTVTHGHVVTCGSVRSANHGQLRLFVPRTDQTVDIAMSRITSVAPVIKCP